MTPAEALAELERIRIVPVAVIDDATHARDVAIALRDAGIPTAEVALRTGAAVEAIRAMANVDGFMVGAGTVVDRGAADTAMEAGASYLVSPGLDDELVRHAAGRGIALIPGVATGTEVQRAQLLGLTHVKLFPAGVLGGRSLIDAFEGPFPRIRFLPSGGVTLETMPAYLGARSVFAVSGSWMLPRGAVESGDVDAISSLTAEAVASARGA